MTDRTSSQTVLALLRKAELVLAQNGTEDPAFEARELTAAALECSPAELRFRYNEDAPSDMEFELMRTVDLRLKGEPLQYIIGSWSFMGRDYKVGRGVLIPRDDTEVVVSEVLSLMRDIKAPRVIDLCSGSGIIAITVKKEFPEAEVCAVEKSPEALAYLRINAARNDADIIVCEKDIFTSYEDFPDGEFDMMISNPPYIKSADLASLQREVQHEPRLALDGGESGYDFYEGIISLWSSKLKPGGYIAFEIGEEQFGHISELLKDAGYSDIKGYPDIQGITRAVTAVKGFLS